MRWACPTCTVEQKIAVELPNLGDGERIPKRGEFGMRETLCHKAQERGSFRESAAAVRAEMKADLGMGDGPVFGLSAFGTAPTNLALSGPIFAVTVPTDLSNSETRARDGLCPSLLPCAVSTSTKAGDKSR